MKKITHARRRKKEAAIKKKRSNYRLRNKDNHVDRISQLPDDILISILSRLSMRQAMATSVLSARWRHLYTRMHHLLIHTTKLSQNQEEFSNYVDTVDKTLDLFSGNADLKLFYVNLHHCFEGANLPRWLEFALAREVETIYMSMCYDDERFHYALQLSNLIDGQTTLPGLRSLKKLILSGIHLEDQEVELLLSNFPLLETLSISKSDKLKNVSIVGCGNQGLMLKHLGLSSVNYLESLEIRDMINLESFTCYGYDMYDLRLTNVPKLTEMCICEFGVDELPSIPSCILDQLQLLEIRGDPTLLSILPPCELKNLKQLEMNVEMISGYSDHHLQRLFPLIEACTSLETLSVKFMWIDDDDSKEEILDETELVPTRKKLSPNLKKFVLSKYLGSREEMDFALSVMNNAPALEQMIVEPRNADLTKLRIATARARKQFRAVAPSSMSLVINPTLTKSTC